MDGTVRRACAAGLAIGALLAALTACTGEPGARATPRESGTSRARACAEGTFTWSPVTTRDRLTGVSRPERLAEGGGALRNHVRRVYTPVPSVRADGPAPPAAEVLFSLGKETGEIDSDAPTLAEAGDTWAFTDPGQRAPALGEDRVTPREAGTYYQYAGVREVSADFRHTCQDGRTVVDRARTWTVDIAGVTGCGERPDTALAREAARRACGPAGAPATGP
ncbi:hypothetical protein ACIPM2_19545 [Streptomyces sp. NPDC086081]|uniref:hypothetical protein n=1 Tax=Streptomyces sp. NPDC086081 TaxID=3365749 RepID=UPI00380CCB51